MPAAAGNQRQGKNKSTSRGRGAVVANSTQLMGPINRKQSHIISQGQANERETKKTQLSQQQVYEFRSSLLQNPVANVVNTKQQPESGAISREA